ncbi:histidine--tRNA ligase [Arcticibacterium luteifluviistationis]|uniref:Histidine--tRNA ligase n=1 Tax=Arcticibacterium luteifluviistationis TaxID=1784714 RepID=A0A2Z4G8M0_9BACT|nr:histidine--tRNA ligase [Arcticibacterium luteifluviistationis]AWV97562.1 histidine--tRNA ligase [Arcticibacterium luteifluviistationis]
MSKPSLARGTRDFGPEIMAKRTYILDTIKHVFKKFGFLSLETPAVENLSVLMGKYGEEGDKLLFKILNSGDFAKKLKQEDFDNGAPAMLSKVAEKGLRYDLTVPFARFVAMNRHDLAMPFKRFQVQPVWRADRPQRGRYREFYQCDADVVGTDSLLCEAEIILMLNEAFQKLKLPDFAIKVNNRKILTGISEVIGKPGKEADLCVAIDKLDKIGKEGVAVELETKGFEKKHIELLYKLFDSNALPTNATLKARDSVDEDTQKMKDSGMPEEDAVIMEELFKDRLKNLEYNAQVLGSLKEFLKESKIGLKGIAELEEIFEMVKDFGLDNSRVEVDFTLARGLSYYTGAIFEVQAIGVKMGSISGGGRYDDLTGTFGVSGLSGVGISFGVDRIYDVLDELALFPEDATESTKVLLTNFDEVSQRACLPILKKLRDADIAAELYPTSAKMKKQFDYANKKGIAYVLAIGSEEIKSGKYSLKDMASGEQKSLGINEIIDILHV